MKFKGRDVINSTRKLRIDISDRDVEKGTPNDPENCAAAECIKRTTGAHDVSVHRGIVMIQMKEGGKFQRYMTPSGLRLETIIFDRGGKFMPGEYDLKPVPIDQIARKPRKAPSAPRTKREMALTVRRRVIPGVRRTARQIKKEGEK